MHVVVFANGEFSQAQDVSGIVRAADLILCADGGARHAHAVGLVPHALVGDLDSVSAGLVEQLRAQGVKIQKHPPDKDETDLELTLLYAVELGATEVTVLGAWGGRIDHALGNLVLLAHPKLRGTAVRLICGRQEIRLVRDRATFDGSPGDLLSLLPVYGDAHGVITTGLQYSLRDETLYFGPARGVSNVFRQARPTVSVKAGLLIAVHTRQSENRVA